MRRSDQVLPAKPSGSESAQDMRALAKRFQILLEKERTSLARELHDNLTQNLTVISLELSLMDLAVRSTPKGCEALGFSLMMSIRNFGIALSDVIGSKMMDDYHYSFNSLVLINAATTAFLGKLCP